MRVTIKDIAREAGLSTSTVSLALNKKSHRLSEQTRRRVLEAADRLHYRPNQLAVGLITKRTNTIGLIIPDVSNVFFSELSKGIEERCQEHGYNVLLCTSSDNPKKDVDYLNVMLDRGVDGVLLAMSATASPSVAVECCEIAAHAETPLVLLDRSVGDRSVASVCIHHELGGYLATRHLLELGHRRIGCITGPMASHSAKQRFYGYIRALQEYSVAFDPALVMEGDYHMFSGLNLAQPMLRTGVTAIFAANDMMAYGVYKYAVTHGLHVPKDLSLVGFDNLFFSELMEVPLTSVDQPACEMGACAVSRLLELIENRESGNEETLFTPELIVRKSTCPLPMEKG